MGVEGLGEEAQGEGEVGGQGAVAVQAVLEGLAENVVQDQGGEQLSRSLTAAQLQGGGVSQMRTPSHTDNTHLTSTPVLLNYVQLRPKIRQFSKQTPQQLIQVMSPPPLRCTNQPV